MKSYQKPEFIIKSVTPSVLNTTTSGVPDIEIDANENH